MGKRGFIVKVWEDLIFGFEGVLVFKFCIEFGFEVLLENFMVVLGGRLGVLLEII